jgi:hypothetical protein
MGDELSPGGKAEERRGRRIVRVREGDGEGRDAVTSEDREWIEALEVSFAPPPMNGPRRAVFDARLRERIDRRRTRGRRGRAILLPGTAAAVAVLASLVFWTGPFGSDLVGPGSEDPFDGALVGPALESWEQRLFYEDPAVSGAVVSGFEAGYGEGHTSRTDVGANEGLPAEYAALEWLLLEG